MISSDNKLFKEETSRHLSDDNDEKRETLSLTMVNGDIRDNGQVTLSRLSSSFLYILKVNWK